MMRIELSRRAQRDLRVIAGRSKQDYERIRNSLESLAKADDSLDIAPLQGRKPWRRMRVGDWRVLFRPIKGGGFLVARVINRRDLHTVVRTLE